jgi:hypothetical protein
MRKLEADQQAELAQEHAPVSKSKSSGANGHSQVNGQGFANSNANANGYSNANGTGNGNGNGNGNGETTSAPTSPAGRLSFILPDDSVPGPKEQLAPIGQGRELANGAKSMPASRRTSGYGTFGMEKLSLSVMESGERRGGQKWGGADEDEGDADAQGESKGYLRCCSHVPYGNVEFGFPCTARFKNASL